MSSARPGRYLDQAAMKRDHDNLRYQNIPILAAAALGYLYGGRKRCSVAGQQVLAGGKTNAFLSMCT